MNIHFHQSDAWAQYQESLGKKTFTKSGTDWHFMAILESSAGIKRLYCPYGPTVTSDTSFQAALTALKKIARDVGASFIRIQPVGVDFSHENADRYRAKQIIYSQPSHTWCVDLTQSTDELYSAMKQNTRNICRNFTKKGLVYQQSTDPIDTRYLSDLLRDTGKHNHITVHTATYLHKQAASLLQNKAASLHFMKYEDTVIAAALVYEGKSTSYYAHAASSFTNRNLGAATALLGEILLDAKKKGKHVMDLYGIAPTDDKNHRWSGFTKFKKSFGGYSVSYNETYDIPINQLMYRLYTVLKHLR